MFKAFRKSSLATSQMFKAFRKSSLATSQMFKAFRKSSLATSQMFKAFRKSSLSTIILYPSAQPNAVVKRPLDVYQLPAWCKPLQTGSVAMCVGPDFEVPSSIQCCLKDNHHCYPFGGSADPCFGPWSFKRSVTVKKKPKRTKGYQHGSIRATRDAKRDAKRNSNNTKLNPERIQLWSQSGMKMDQKNNRWCPEEISNTRSWKIYPLVGKLGIHRWQKS